MEWDSKCLFSMPWKEEEEEVGSLCEGQGVQNRLLEKLEDEELISVIL